MKWHPGSQDTRHWRGLHSDHAIVASLSVALYLPFPTPASPAMGKPTHPGVDTRLNSVRLSHKMLLARGFTGNIDTAQTMLHPRAGNVTM